MFYWQVLFLFNCQGCILIHGSCAEICLLEMFVTFTNVFREVDFSPVVPQVEVVVQEVEGIVVQRHLEVLNDQATPPVVPRQSESLAAMIFQLMLIWIHFKLWIFYSSFTLSWFSFCLFCRILFCPWGSSIIYSWPVLLFWRLVPQSIIFCWVFITF